MVDSLMSIIIDLLLIVFYIAVIVFNAWGTVSNYDAGFNLLFIFSFSCLVLTIASGHWFIRGLLIRYNFIERRPPVISFAMRVNFDLIPLRFMRVKISQNGKRAHCGIKMKEGMEHHAIKNLALTLATLAKAENEKELAADLAKWLNKRNYAIGDIETPNQPEKKE